MIQNQLFSFFIYVIVGILLGFIFDIFRAFRRSIKNSNVATNIEDILFVIISFIIIAMVVQIVSKGRIKVLYFIRNYTWNSYIFFKCQQVHNNWRNLDFKKHYKNIKKYL